MAARISPFPSTRKVRAYFLTLNPREPKYYPLTIQASAKVLNAAGVDFTISSRYWDLTNYALFNGNDADAKLFATWQAEDVKRLGCEYLLAGECGHGYRALRWELPNWVGGVPFKITSMMELMAKLVEEGKIMCDKSVWAGTRFTYHDSCNIARSGGVLEEPRIVIRAVPTILSKWSTTENGASAAAAAAERWPCRSSLNVGSPRERSRRTRYEPRAPTWYCSRAITARTNSKKSSTTIISSRR